MTTSFRYLSAALLLLALCSCRKDPATGSFDAQIRFRALGTKAETSAPMPDGSEFSLNGALCSGSSWTSGSEEAVYENITGRVSGNSGACAVGQTRYWRQNSSYRFRALSPIASTVGTYSDALDGNVQIGGFTVISPAETDLVLSDLYSCTTGANVSSLGAVPLTFRHLLCNVHFFVKEDQESGADDDEDIFTVTGARLTGMKSKAGYSGTSTSGTWTPVEAAALSIVNNSPVTVLPGEDSQLFSDGGLILLPQAVSGDIKLILNYSVNHGGEVTNKSVTLTLPTTIWTQGLSYNYRIEFKEDYNVKFLEPGIEEWGATQTTGAIIIK